MKTFAKKLAVGVLAILVLGMWFGATGHAGQSRGICDDGCQGVKFGGNWYWMDEPVRFDLPPVSTQSRAIYLDASYTYYIVLKVLPSGWNPWPPALVPISLGVKDFNRKMSDPLLWVKFGFGEIVGYVNPEHDGYYYVLGSSPTGCWGSLAVYASGENAPYPY